MDFSVAVEGVEPDVARAQLAAWVAPVAAVAELVGAAEEALAADGLAADAVEEELPAAWVAVAAAAAPSISAISWAVSFSSPARMTPSACWALRAPTIAPVPAG